VWVSYEKLALATDKQNGARNKERDIPTLLIVLIKL